MSLASIQKEIVQESLDETRIKETEAKWAMESEERIDAFDRGELSAVDGPAALYDLRESLITSTPLPRRS